MNPYLSQAKQKIDITKLSPNPSDRISEVTKNLLKQEFVIDVHTHFFDINCINESYFAIRLIKDLIGLKSGNEKIIEYSVEEAYKNIHKNEDEWAENLKKKLEDKSISYYRKQDKKKGIIDILKATSFLALSSNESVYQHYINNFSLASIFKLPSKNVLTTALMIDLEMGWNVKISKSFFEQIEELKQLSKYYPTLPFLFCHPERADKIKDKENLYKLFNYAFCTPNPFFGIKIYPGLGYDPSDYRLWPIYELCENFSIPVLSHCGGESISVDKNTVVYEGTKKTIIKGNTRSEIAYQLNNPNRWRVVLEKFPKLKLNLAHFGGYETWSPNTKIDSSQDQQNRKETIFNLMQEFKNVYADFAYNIIETSLAYSLKSKLLSDELLRERTLFGSDYWVVNKEANLKKSQEKFLTILEEHNTFNLKRKLCIDNPLKYLFDKVV